MFSSCDRNPTPITLHMSLFWSPLRLPTLRRFGATPFCRYIWATLVKNLSYFCVVSNEISGAVYIYIFIQKKTPNSLIIAKFHKLDSNHICLNHLNLLKTDKTPLNYKKTKITNILTLFFKKCKFFCEKLRQRNQQFLLIPLKIAKLLILKIT